MSYLKGNIEIQVRTLFESIEVTVKFPISLIKKNNRVIEKNSKVMLDIEFLEEFKNNSFIKVRKKMNCDEFGVIISDVIINIDSLRMKGKITLLVHKQDNP